MDLTSPLSCCAAAEELAVQRPTLWLTRCALGEFRSITSDNGTESHGYRRIEAATGEVRKCCSGMWNDRVVGKVGADSKPLEHGLRLETTRLMSGLSDRSRGLISVMVTPFDKSYDVEPTWSRRLFKYIILDATIYAI